MDSADGKKMCSHQVMIRHPQIKHSHLGEYAYQGGMLDIKFPCLESYLVYRLMGAHFRVHTAIRGPLGGILPLIP